MRQTEMQGEGTAAAAEAGGWLDGLDIEAATGKARIFAPMPPYGLLSKPLANIYERVIGRIPSIPSINPLRPAAGHESAGNHHRFEEGKMTQARMDLYASIHKGLRSFMAETLGAVGRMDADDDAERHDTLAQLRALLELLDRHARHEDDFIHPVLQARRPGAARSCGAEHERQREQLRALRRQADAVEAASDAARAAAALDLYRQLALMIADGLAHMHEEETANNAVLWAECTDDELTEIHDRIVDSVDAEEMAQVIRWMAPSLTPYERATLFGALQAKAPAEVFRRLLEVARPHLAPRDWNKLIFGIAAAPLAV